MLVYNPCTVHVHDIYSIQVNVCYCTILITGEMVRLWPTTTKRGRPFAVLAACSLFKCLLQEIAVTSVGLLQDTF